MSDPAFERWWETECGGTRGGAAAKVKKLCEIAWSNGAYLEKHKGCAPEKFTELMPGSPGLYEFICGETDGVPERCAIIDHGFGAWLVVHSEHLGETPVKHFHDGLTNIRWRKIA
jgi:hypothetical protein